MFNLYKSKKFLELVQRAILRDGCDFRSIYSILPLQTRKANDALKANAIRNDGRFAPYYLTQSRRVRKKFGKPTLRGTDRRLLLNDASALQVSVDG
jgi:hypothetical protein